MGGTSKQAAQTSSQTDPWKPAQPLLQDILGKAGGMLGNVGLNPSEQTALSGLRESAGSAGSYAPQIGMLAKDLFSGGADQSPIVRDAYSNLQTSLAPTASGEFLDPNKNPYTGQLLQSVGDDAATRINSMFAGAGRDLSGVNQRAVARGVSEATAPILAGMFNSERDRQLGAAGTLFGAGGQTAGLLSELSQKGLGNRLTGVGVSEQALSKEAAPYERALEVEGMARNIPQQALGWLASLGVPIAGLGGTQNATQTGTKTMSGTEQALAWSQIAKNLFSQPQQAVPFGF